MKIFIAADHNGYKLKKYIIKNLKGYEIEDLGTDSTESVDYTDFAFDLCKKVLKNNTLGIVICGTGIGMSIACNKVKGIRCAKVNSQREAYLTRNDNDSNVIALSSHISEKRVINILKTFLETPTSIEEKHKRRINKIKEYEKSN